MIPIQSEGTVVEPPDELDGAEVILWAFNPLAPFFIMRYSDGAAYKPIHGFAVCRYRGENQFYKFSCDREWNVENDMACDSLEKAVNAAQNMSIEPVIWIEKKSSRKTG